MHFDAFRCIANEFILDGSQLQRPFELVGCKATELHGDVLAAVGGALHEEERRLHAARHFQEPSCAEARPLKQIVLKLFLMPFLL